MRAPFRFDGLALFASAALLVAAGCAGNAGSSGVAPPSRGISGSGTADATLTITIPGSGSSTTSRAVQSVRPNYVSQNAESLTIVVDSQTFEYNLTATSNGCTQPGGSGTAVTCTETLTAPVGTYSWAFTLWSSTNGTGSKLALDTQSETITAGITNTITVTLNGVVGSYTLAWASGPSFAVNDSSAQTATLNLTVEDPSGATIIAPGSYVNTSGTAVTFAMSDNQPSGNVYTTYGYALGTTSIGSPSGSSTPSNTVTVTYKGVSIPTVTFKALDSAGIQSAGATVTAGPYLGTLGATVTCNEPSNNDTCTNGTGAVGSGGTAGTASFLGGGDTATIAVAELGWSDSPYSQSFTSSNNTCTGGSAGSTLSGSSPTWTLTANTGDNPGSCSDTFEDNAANDQLVTVNATYTYESVIIQSHHVH